MKKQINLLPKERQREIYYKYVLRSLYSAVLISLASFVFVILAQFGIKLYLDAQLQITKDLSVQVKGMVDKKENAEIKAQINAINGRIGEYENLAESTPKWSKVLKAFAVLPPQGVEISSLRVNMANKTIGINGFAPTRELVIATYESILSDTKEFSNIDYPLENVIKADDIYFHYTFNINAELLK